MGVVVGHSRALGVVWSLRGPFALHPAGPGEEPWKGRRARPRAPSRVLAPSEPGHRPAHILVLQPGPSVGTERGRDSPHSSLGQSMLSGVSRQVCKYLPVMKRSGEIPPRLRPYFIFFPWGCGWDLLCSLCVAFMIWGPLSGARTVP